MHERIELTRPSGFLDYGMALTVGTYVVPNEIETVASHLASMPSHDDLLFCAMLFSGFFALMRQGKLTDSDTLNLRDPRKVIRLDTKGINFSAATPSLSQRTRRHMTHATTSSVI